MEKKRIPLQIKSLSNREFEGYGSIFGNEDLGGDIVAKGAFSRSLKQYGAEQSLPLMFWAHDPAQVPGKWLEMSEDNEGLRVKGVLADTQLGNEVRTLLGMGAVRGLSIGYQTVEQDYGKDGVRVIKEAKLWEVSVVSLPMNPLAQVQNVKTRTSSDGAQVPTPRQLEQEFRRMGCSKSVARTLVSKIFDGAGGMPESDDEENTAGAMHAEPEATADSRCDADDERKLLEALQAMNDSLAVERMIRRSQDWRKPA